MLVIFEELALKSAGAGNPIVWEVKQAGQKTSLAEQETSLEIQEKK